MKGKYYIGLAILVLVVIGIFAFGFSSPPEDAVRAGVNENLIAGEQQGSIFSGEKMAITKEGSSVEFIGYKPGGSHPGVFEEWDGSFYYEDGQIVGVEGVIQVSSVKTDSERVDAHLQNDDFFDVENYPTIEFSGMVKEGVMTGPLTFHGVTHEVSFPVEVSETGLNADFVLDTTPFNFKHVGTNKEVSITFNFVK